MHRIFESMYYIISIIIVYLSRVLYVHMYISITELEDDVDDDDDD